MSALLILMPLSAIIIMNLAFRTWMRKIAFPFAMLLFIVQITMAVFHHPVFMGNAFARADVIFKFGFHVDHLSFIMFMCMGIAALTSLIIAKYSIIDEKESFKFINLLIIASIGMNGIVMTRDMFSLYVFLEITSVASFIMIAFNKSLDSLEGSFKYMILSSVASILMLAALALILLTSGDTSFGAIAAALKISDKSILITFATAIFICGLFIKGGIVPFHGWLPDAYMAAPAPVSILLAGIVTKAAGIYTLMRIVSGLFGFNGPIGGVLMVFGLLSIIVGAFAALGQTDFKRMLAYSSISQVGYIVLALGTGTALGIIGAAFHLFNHSVFKSLLFVNSTAVERQLGTNDINRMGGLAARMPVTGATSVIGILSASGIPPMSGFWSKLIIVVALWQSAHYFYAYVAVVASVLTLAYLLLLQRKVFFGKLMEGLEGLREAEFGITLISVILAIIIIGAGIFFPFVYNDFLMPVKDILIR